LTARMYAKAFDAPFVADYELRGTNEDLEVVYRRLKDVAEKQG
ncbi:MAG: ribonucleotide reductase assembly protein NrdI, partial [Limosilactobacillus fermentum]|nr:ribonucleotide reductase assembly protein NrdI [Limosilactobacillus fermentum]